MSNDTGPTPNPITWVVSVDVYFLQTSYERDEALF